MVWKKTEKLNRMSPGKSAGGASLAACWCLTGGIPILQTMSLC